MADYLPSIRLHGSAYIPDVDRRRTPRKKLVRRVTLVLASGEVIKGKTVDISQGGLSVLIEKSLAAEQPCAVRFDLYFNGRSVLITGSGKVRNCSLAGLHGFRIGMAFTVASVEAQEFINEYLAVDGQAAPGTP